MTPLLEALHSENCKLKTIKMSIGSLSTLDLQSCKILGYLLNNAGVNVLISRVSSLLEVKTLFERFDRSKNGYLDQDEFLTALKELRSPMHHRPIQKQKRVFQELAIRRPKNRDRLYFYDFFHKVADIKCEDKKKHLSKAFDFDLTNIKYPSHFIFQRIKASIDMIAEHGNEKCIDRSQEKHMMANMGKLFHFCEGLSILNQIDTTLGQHVFYTIIDALYSIDNIKDDKKKLITNYEKLLWLFFLNLLENPIFDSPFYLNRNNIFKIDFITERVKLLEANEFIRKLDTVKDECGYNIFEYCFLYKDHKRNKCRSFVYLFDAFLKAINRDTQLLLNSQNFVGDLIGPNGELEILFKGTNGFFMKDANDHTPLYYAVRNGQDDVVEFFAQYILTRKNTMKSKSPVPGSPESPSFCDQKSEDEEFNVPWIDDQDYLHSILHGLFLTKSLTPNPDLLRLLLATNKINVNYYCAMYGGYLGHHILRYRSNNNQKDKVYLLKCLQILNYAGFDFVNNLDSATENNILHYAVLLNDVEAVELIINMLKDQNKSKLILLINSRNKQEKMAIDVAMELGHHEITDVLLKIEEQQCDFKAFTMNQETFHLDGDYGKELRRREKEKQRQWINSFAKIITSSKGKVLNRFDQKEKEELLAEVNTIFETMRVDGPTPGGPPKMGTKTSRGMNSKIERTMTKIGTRTMRTGSNVQPPEEQIEYENLQTIVLHLHKNLGIALTKKPKSRPNSMELGMGMFINMNALSQY